MPVLEPIRGSDSLIVRHFRRTLSSPAALIRWCHSRVFARSPPIELCFRSLRMSASDSKRSIPIRSLAVGAGASAACALLCAFLMGQQQGTGRLGESQEEADRKSVGCVACHG